jgi:hypothetical protein
LEPERALSGQKMFGKLRARLLEIGIDGNKKRCFTTATADTTTNLITSWYFPAQTRNGYTAHELLRLTFNTRAHGRIGVSDYLLDINKGMITAEESTPVFVAAESSGGSLVQLSPDSAPYLAVSDDEACMYKGSAYERAVATQCALRLHTNAFLMARLLTDLTFIEPVHAERQSLKVHEAVAA